MKKLIFLICFVAATFTAETVNAQLDFQKGSGILNVSIGVGNALYSGYNHSVVIPPLAVSYEVGVADGLIDGNASIGVGGYLGFAASRTRFNWGGLDYGTNYTNIVIGPRGTFHYQFVEKLDTYVGALLGANIASTSHYGTYSGPRSSTSGGGLAFDAFLGARYFFNPNTAIMAELGHGIAYFNLGAAFRLK